MASEFETAAWSAWDTTAAAYMSNLISVTLATQQQTSGLYYFQQYSHSLVHLCRETENATRLREIYTMIEAAYDELSGGQWLDGGSAEIVLNSVQFLGIAATVARSLVEIGAASAGDKAFVAQTSEIIISHLYRWSESENWRIDTAGLKTIMPVDIINTASTYFCNERHLWMIHCLAELSGILNNASIYGVTAMTEAQEAALSAFFSELLQLFRCRTHIEYTGSEYRAYIDTGYWRKYLYHQYAGYTDAENPPTHMDGEDLVYDVEASAVDEVPTLGWDISHGRRIPHVLNAISRNRSEIGTMFGLSGQLPESGIAGYFANSIIADWWNDDSSYPLFSNYMDGTNGWYRVGYPSIQTGYPPSGITSSVPLGGYGLWRTFNSSLQSLALTIYTLVNSVVQDDIDFITDNYAEFKGSATTQALAKIQFYPTLG